MRMDFGTSIRPPTQAPLVDRELTVLEMLADPIVIRLMRRDRVTRKDITNLFARPPRGRLCRAA